MLTCPEDKNQVTLGSICSRTGGISVADRRRTEKAQN